MLDMSPLAPRVRELAPSMTMAITAKAAALRAQGVDVIGFGSGQPDFPTPAHVVSAAAAACGDPAMHGYTPGAGLPALRESVARKTRRDSGVVVEPEQVLVTNGAKHSLYNVFQALLAPGDEVILPAPYWVSYPEQIRLAGGVVQSVATGAEGGYRVSIDQLDAALTPKTKALVFVSPSNPTGAVYQPDEVERIGRWAAEAGIWVITDEIYEHLVYGDAVHASMPALVPEMRERCVIVNGVAKTYAMTGWRVGWSIAPTELTAAMGRLQSHTTSNVSNVAQAAALAALEGPFDEVRMMRETYDRRRRLTHERLAAIDGVVCPLPQGAFYAFPSFQGLLGGAIKGRPVTTSLDLCDVLLDVAQVALVPGEAFGAPGHARLSYALSDRALETGLDRMVEALS